MKHNVTASWLLCSVLVSASTAVAGPLPPRTLKSPQVQERTASHYNIETSHSLLKEDVTLIVRYSAAAAGPTARAATSAQISTTGTNTDLAQKLSSLGLRNTKAVFPSASKVRKTTSSTAGSKGVASIASTSVASLSTADRLAALQKKFPQRAARAATTQANFDPPSLNLQDYFTVVVPKGKNLRDTIKTVSKMRGVQSVYPSIKYSASRTIPGASAYENAWGIAAISAPQAWKTAKTLGDGILVGINDTGIYYKHAALAPNAWTNPGEIPGNCIDDDNNGYVDDEHGVDFTQSSVVKKGCSTEDSDSVISVINQPFDCNGHGSHVAGTIGATDTDDEGVTGVAPGVKLIAAKGLTDEGSGSTEALAKAIIYLTDSGADVINNSWGAGPVTYADPLMTDAIRYAASAGVINVFAAGNSSSDMTLSHPATMKEVITVGAIDSDNKRADFSNYGARIDVVAPGVDINSSFPDGCDNKESDPVYGDVPVTSHDYTQISGTSMAAPHVVGAVALILAAKPSLRIDEVRSILRATADDLGAQGFDPYFGAGRVNVQRAVTYALANEGVPLVDLRLSSDSVSRNKNGKINPIDIRGTIAGAASYKVSARLWTATSAPTTLLSGNQPVRNGLIGKADLSNLSDGKYVIELVATTASGKKVGRTETVAIAPLSQTLASMAGMADNLLVPTSFNRKYAVWRPAGSLFSSEASPIEDAIQVVNRGKTNSVAASYLVTNFMPQLFLKDKTVVADLFQHPKLSGLSPDIAVLPGSDGSTTDPRLISVALPPTGRPISVETYSNPSGRYGLLWRRLVGVGTTEMKILGLRLGSDLVESTGAGTNSQVETIVTSPKGAFFWGPTIEYPATLTTNAVLNAGALVTFEGRLNNETGVETDVLVRYALGAPNMTASKKVLYTPKATAWIDSIDYGFGLGCMLIIDPTVGKGASILAIHTTSGAQFPVADQPKGTMGICRVPQSNFVTYLQASPTQGLRLAGYDINTGKSGAITLSAGVTPSSMATTGDGNLSWQEFYGAGSRLIEFDISAFRKGINDGTVPKP